jgi:4-hydroxy-tetrahydrodipicolinate synthase
MRATGYDKSTAWPSAFSGVIAAAATPMTSDLAVDLDRVPDYADFLLAKGAGALMVGGTTGEFLALTEVERNGLVREFIRAVAGRVPVIAHVGHIDRRTAHRLAEAAAADGADALAAIVPYFHHAAQGAIESSLAEIARVAPHLPFFVYHYPAATGNQLEPATFARLLETPNVHGIKLSVDSWSDLQLFLGFDRRILAVCGNDRLMEPFFRAGGRAVVSGNAAALPEVIAEAVRGFAASDSASRTRAGHLVEKLVLLTLAGSVDRLKAILALRGMDIGPSRVRTHVAAEVAPPTSTELKAVGVEA